jgi:hypothetical protein
MVILFPIFAGDSAGNRHQAKDTQPHAGGRLRAVPFSFYLVYQTPTKM